MMDEVQGGREEVKREARFGVPLQVRETDIERWRDRRGIGII